MAKGKKLTLKTVETLKPKVKRHQVIGKDGEGNDVPFYVDVDEKFIDSKLAELGAEFVLTMAYDDVYADGEEQIGTPLEDKLINSEPYILGLILKHFTSIDVDGTFEEIIQSLLVLQDYGLWKEITSVLPEEEVNKTFKYIEQFIETNHANISEALERAKNEVENNELLAQFKFMEDEEDEVDE